MSNQPIETNPQTNQNSFPPEENFNLNINNYDMDIIRQKQQIDNLPIEEILKKIDTYLKENNLSELVNILKLSQGKINKNLLSNYISENLKNIDVIRIFLNSGADVNSYIHCTDYKIDENEKINLLMFSIMTENLAMFKLILQYHPDVLQEDEHKKNSLYYYISFNEDPNMLHDLLQLNPDAINSVYYDHENNITHNLLTFAASKNKKDLCSILIKYNCNLNYQIPETGDTFIHLIVKNDNIEIAKLLLSVPNIDRSLKNKDGKTARELGEEKRGNIYFQIICKENTINNMIANNQNKNTNINNNNNNNLVNNETNNNIKPSKKGNDIFNKISANLISNANNHESEKNYYDNIPQENYVVPIEFNNVDCTTYLSMGQDMKLCLNLFQSEYDLRQQIEDLEKQLKEKTDSIANLENLNNQRMAQLQELRQDMSKVDDEIKKQKKLKSSQEKQILEIKTQNEDFTKLLKNLKIIPDSNGQNPAPNPLIQNPENSTNELLNFPISPLSEEEFNFLEGKFHSQSYDHNYIVSCLQKDLTDYQAYVKEQIAQKKPLGSNKLGNIDTRKALSKCSLVSPEEFG